MSVILENMKKRKYFFLSIGVVIFIFSMMMFFFNFFQQLRESEVERCKDELIEVSVKGTTILKNQLDFATDLLETSSVFVTNIERSISREAMLEILDEIRMNSDFERVGITDRYGNALLSNGMSANVKEKRYFEKSIEGVSYITNVFESMLEENLRIFIVSVPIYKTSEIVGVLYGVIETEKLSEIYNQHEHISNRYFHIVDHKGDYILKSNHDYSILKKDNLWDDLETFDFGAGYNLDEMKRNFEEDKSGLVSYSKAEENRFCYYMPLDINEWFILSCAPQGVVYEHVDSVNGLLINLGIKVFIAIVLFVALLYLFNLAQYYEMRKRNEELKVTSEVLKIATDEITNGIFEYDVRTKRVAFKNDYYKRNGLSEVLYDIPTALIVSGRVCEESTDEFRNLFEMMGRGKVKESGEVCINHGDGKIWERITLTNVFNDVHEIVRTIGIVEDITALKERELKFLQELEYRKAMMVDTVDSWEINLTQDLVVKSSAKMKKTYSESLLKYVLTCVHKEDQHHMLNQCSIMHLLSLFAKGAKDVKIEYRVKDEQGGYVWFECSIHMSQSVENEDILAYIFTKNIHQKKQREIELKYVAEHDALSGLYNRAACEHYIDEFLEDDENALDLHAFIIFDLDNFKEVNDQFGHGYGDEVLKEVANLLVSRFRNSDIIARLGGDEFIIFLKNIHSIDNVKKHAQGLVDAMQLSYVKDGKTVNVSASVGIALALTDGRSFKQLYAKADLSLYHVKQLSKNGYEIYSQTVLGSEKDDA